MEMRWDKNEVWRLSSLMVRGVDVIIIVIIIIIIYLYIYFIFYYYNLIF